MIPALFILAGAASGSKLALELVTHWDAPIERALSGVFTAVRRSKGRGKQAGLGQNVSLSKTLVP
jgi:hypothetical protein